MFFVAALTNNGAIIIIINLKKIKEGILHICGDSFTTLTTNQFNIIIY